MCVVSVFYCLDCKAYSDIPFKGLTRSTTGPVSVVESQLCLQVGCSRRLQVFSSVKDVGRGSRTCLDCSYPLCTQDTCRLNLVLKSCREGWRQDPQNILPVQLVVKMSGNAIFYEKITNKLALITKERWRVWLSDSFFIKGLFLSLFGLKERFDKGATFLSLVPSFWSCL